MPIHASQWEPAQFDHHETREDEPSGSATHRPQLKLQNTPKTHDNLTITLQYDNQTFKSKSNGSPNARFGAKTGEGNGKGKLDNK